MPAPNRYQVGDRVRASVQFRTIAEVPVDPSGIVAKYKTPAGSVTTKTYGSDAEVVRTGTGAYYIDIDVSAAGTWYYRFNGTGTVAADEKSFVAEPTEF